MVSPLWLRWVKGACVFRCKLPPALLAEWSGSFRCQCGNTGAERTPNNSQHTKLTLEKKILPPLLSGFELATFRSRVRRSNQQAIPVPMWIVMQIDPVVRIRVRWFMETQTYPACTITMALLPSVLLVVDKEHSQVLLKSKRELSD